MPEDVRAEEEEFWYDRVVPCERVILTVGNRRYF